MGKKVYSQEDFNKLMSEKFNDLRKIYLESKNHLSLKTINLNLQSMVLEFADPAFEPLPKKEFEDKKNQFDSAFNGSGSEFENFNSIFIDSSNFRNVVHDNNKKNYIYIYFLTTNTCNVCVGLRFSDTPDLKNDLTTVYEDSFYILNMNEFSKETQSNFKTAVDNFHSNYDQIISQYTNATVTLYIRDLVIDAINIINLNPNTIKMDLILEENTKLCIGTTADVNGSELFFNRGQLWP